MRSFSKFFSQLASLTYVAIIAFWFCLYNFELCLSWGVDAGLCISGKVLVLTNVAFHWEENVICSSSAWVSSIERISFGSVSLFNCCCPLLLETGWSGTQQECVGLCTCHHITWWTASHGEFRVCVHACVCKPMCVCVCVCVKERRKIELTVWGKKVPIALDGIRTCISGIRAHSASDCTTTAGTPRVSRMKHFRHSPVSSIAKQSCMKCVCVCVQMCVCVGGGGGGVRVHVCIAYLHAYACLTRDCWFFFFTHVIPVNIVFLTLAALCLNTCTFWYLFAGKQSLTTGGHSAVTLLAVTGSTCHRLHNRCGNEKVSITFWNIPTPNGNGSLCEKADQENNSFVENSGSSVCNASQVFLLCYSQLKFCFCWVFVQSCQRCSQLPRPSSPNEEAAISCK